MLRRCALAVVALVACMVSLGRADDAADARTRFKKEMDAVYDYLPFDVAQDVRDAKVAQMDRFWALVASDRKTYLPLLREALRDPKSNLYFLYDGSGCLFENSHEPADVQLAADATARCRVKDVGKGYFYFCHALARSGADPVPAVLQMLGEPDYSVYVVQHSLRMRQGDCVRLCLMLLDEAKWVPELTRRLATEKDPVAVATIVRCLGDAATTDAEAALRAVAADEKADAAKRKLAQSALDAATPKPLEGDTKWTHEDLVAWLSKADADGRLPRDAESRLRDCAKLVIAGDEPVLRSLRRKTARRISDEALIEIDWLTSLLRRAVTAKK